MTGDDEGVSAFLGGDVEGNIAGGSRASTAS